MSEPAQQDHLLERWMDEIRAAADRKRAACPPCAVDAVAHFNWPQRSVALGRIAPHALVGTEVPPIRRYRGPLRYLALFVAKAVLYLTKFITTRQREFNLSLLQFLREMGEGVRDLELRLERQDERVRRLEEQLAAREGRRAS